MPIEKKAEPVHERAPRQKEFERLVSMTRSQNPQDRVHAYDRLSSYGSEAIPAYASSLEREKEPELRRLIIERLGMVGDERAVEALGRVVMEGSDRRISVIDRVNDQLTRARAAEAIGDIHERGKLGEAGTKQAVEVLTRSVTLGDPSRMATSYVLEALARIGDPSSLPLLRKHSEKLEAGIKSREYASASRSMKGVKFKSEITVAGEAAEAAEKTPQKMDTLRAINENIRKTKRMIQAMEEERYSKIAKLVPKKKKRVA